MAALLLMVSQGIQAQHVTRAVAHRGYWTL